MVHCQMSMRTRRAQTRTVHMRYEDAVYILRFGGFEPKHLVLGTFRAVDNCIARYEAGSTDAASTCSRHDRAPIFSAVAVQFRVKSGPPPEQVPRKVMVSARAIGCLSDVAVME